MTQHFKNMEKNYEIIEQRIKKELDPILKYDFDVIY